MGLHVPQTGGARHAAVRRDKVESTELRPTDVRVNLSMNPHLFGCLLLLAFWGITCGIVFTKGRKLNRREFWWGSLACALLGSTEPLFVPEYWAPPSILAYRRWDFESFLFCFAVGGIAAVAPEAAIIRGAYLRIDDWLCRFGRGVLALIRRLTGAEPPAPAWSEVALDRATVRQENALLAAFFLGAFGFTAHFHLNIIYDAALACAAMGVYIAWRRPRLRWQVIGGGLSFLVIYGVVLRVVGWVYPTFFTDYWNLKELSGVWIFGAPAEESVFALTLGVFWGPLYEAWKNERTCSVPASPRAV